MKTLLRAGSTSLCAFLITAAAAAQDKGGDAPALGCDRSAIEWVLPGSFEDARSRAVADKRLVIIKGISFGVDEAGAQCATKGKW